MDHLLRHGRFFELFGSVALGLLLYGLQLAANLAAAACLVLFLPKQELPAGQGSSQQKSVTFPQAISNAVQSSLTVCGCAVFCRVVGSVLGQGMPDGARPFWKYRATRFIQSFFNQIIPHSLAFRHPFIDRKSTRLNSSHSAKSRMPSSA